MNILANSEVREIVEKSYSVCINSRFMVKVVDYSENPVAPERYAYKVFFTDSLTKERRKFVLYPNTVGLQYLK